MSRNNHTVMKQPDRFERIAEKAGLREEPDVEKATRMAVTLLRREHAAVQRMVLKLLRDEKVETYQSAGYRLGLRHTLAALDARQKG